MPLPHPHQMQAWLNISREWERGFESPKYQTYRHTSGAEVRWPKEAAMSKPQFVQFLGFLMRDVSKITGLEKQEVEAQMLQIVLPPNLRSHQGHPPPR